MGIRKIIGLLMLSCVCFHGMFSSDTTELLLYRSIMQVELKGFVAFPLSWKQRTSATLTISQDVRTVLTEVVCVNGTDVRISNSWQNKAMINVHNESEVMYLNVTLSGVTTEDEGTYSIKLRENDKEDIETLFNTGYFYIETYALPIYIKIHADQTDVNEHTEITVTCSGNFGRPVGKLQLLQSANSQPVYFYPIASVLLSELPDIQDSMLLNGTFYVQHTFRRNISRIDNGTSFSCEILHYMTKATILRSESVPINVNCECLDLPITRFVRSLYMIIQIQTYTLFQSI